MIEQEWGFIGSGVVFWFLKDSGEIEYVQDKDVFFFIIFKDCNYLILSWFNIEDEIIDNMRVIYFWVCCFKLCLCDNEDNKLCCGSFLDKMFKYYGID